MSYKLRNKCHKLPTDFVIHSLYPVTGTNHMEDAMNSCQRKKVPQWTASSLNDFITSM